MLKMWEDEACTWKTCAIHKSKVISHKSKVESYNLKVKNKRKSKLKSDPRRLPYLTPSQQLKSMKIRKYLCKLYQKHDEQIETSGIKNIP